MFIPLVYIKNYIENGIALITANKSTESPRKLNKEQGNIILDLVTNNTPDEVGFNNRKNWTIDLVRQWIEKNLNIIINPSSMAVILHRLNLSYIRPTYILKKADKNKQEIFKKTVWTSKKHLNGEASHILFQDESIIRDYQAIQKTWFLKGQPKKISTYGKNAGVKIIRILNYESGHVYCEDHDKYDAEVF